MFELSEEKKQEIRDKWKGAKVSALIDHILEVHHEPTKKLVGEIKALLPEAEREWGDDPAFGTLASAVTGTAMILKMHAEKEEECLFPMARKLALGATMQGGFGSIRGPIQVMDQEHRDLDAALERMRKLTDNYGAEKGGEATRALFAKLRAWDEDMAVHTFVEDEVLFPMITESEKS